MPVSFWEDIASASVGGLWMMNFSKLFYVQLIKSTMLNMSLIGSVSVPGQKMCMYLKTRCKLVKTSDFIQ